MLLFMYAWSCMKTTRAAFTLLELSIVLVIVGLLAGGIMGGLSMMRAAELNKITSLAGKQQAAIIQFRQNYNGAPGDLRDAESYWGTDPNGCPTNSVHTPRRETCNGNGNGAISGAESFRATQQLAAAGLIDGGFSGVTGAGGTQHAVPAQNVPAGPNGVGMFLVSEGPYASHSTWFDMPASIVLQLGKSSTGRTVLPFLTPRDAANLDRKMDDGRPALGAMLAYKSAFTPGCATTDAATATYNATQSGITCALVYRIDRSTDAI